ncbi:MAG: hypothetical protein ICV54_20575, partial [Nostoc sp. C3-bin3]|nr:hypothetical protein [Nostoc sp. C3-bin3]
MVKQATLQSNKLTTIEDAKFALDKFNIQNEKLHPQGDGVFGDGEWVMGHGEEGSNALFPMPQATGQLSLSTHVRVASHR